MQMHFPGQKQTWHIKQLQRACNSEGGHLREAHALAPLLRRSLRWPGMVGGGGSVKQPIGWRHAGRGHVGKRL